MNSDHLVLITGYNRPESLTRQIGTLIRQKRKFVISIDGPKSAKDSKSFQCQEIAREAKKSCPFLTDINTPSNNLGCKSGMIAAIDWAFQFTDKLIILEDDVLTSTDFFRFMDFALHKYEKCPDIFLVNGWSPITKYSDILHYYESRFFSPWGWATWRNRWKLYDRDLLHINTEKDLRDLPGLQKYSLNYFFYRYMKSKLIQCKNGYDTWDYQLMFSMWLSGKSSITPCVRLVGNDGFGVDATHTKSRLHFWHPNLVSPPITDNHPSFKEFSKILVEQHAQDLDYDIDKLVMGFSAKRNFTNLAKIGFNSLKRRIF